MGQMYSIEIVLDSTVNQFLPGSLVSGRVVLKKAGKQTCSGIAITIFGKVDTKWVEYHRYHQFSNNLSDDHFHSDRYHREVYRGSKTFFEDSYQLFGNGKRRETLPDQDLIEFPFTFQLPSPLLHSFQVECAKVHYGLEVKVKKSNIKKVLYQFSVLPNPLDLNLVHGADLPSDGEGERGSKKNPLYIKLECPVKGVCAGDTLYVNAEISNFSNKEVRSLTGKLVQIWQFVASGCICCAEGKNGFSVTKLNPVVLAEIKRDKGVVPREITGWQFQFIIPSKVPVSIPIEVFEVIGLAYEVQLEADIKGARNLTVSVPLIVGDVPVKPREQGLQALFEHNSLFEGAVGGGLA